MSFFLVLRDFCTEHTVHIQPHPNSRQGHPHFFQHPALHPFFLLHHVQFILDTHYWICGLRWREVSPPGTTPLNNTDSSSPRGHQLPSSSSLAQARLWCSPPFFMLEFHLTCAQAGHVKADTAVNLCVQSLHCVQKNSISL